MAVWLALSAVAWSAAASTPPALAPHPLRELRRSRSNAPGLCESPKIAFRTGITTAAANRRLHTRQPPGTAPGPHPTTCATAYTHRATASRVSAVLVAACLRMADAQYDWPKPTPASSTDMEVDHTWITIPTGTDADGNGVFASSQFWCGRRLAPRRCLAGPIVCRASLRVGAESLVAAVSPLAQLRHVNTERVVRSPRTLVPCTIAHHPRYDAYDTPCPAKSAHGMSCNSAGYMGSQVMKGSGGAEKVVFVFSCWDADSSHMVGWTTPKTCGRFGGEGTGSHCILEYPVKVGVKYNFRVAFSGQNQTGAFWSGTVTDSVTKAQTKVGTLFYPHLPNRTGFGNFKVQSDDFLEYFLGGDCDGAVTTAVGITGPYFHKRTVTATQAYPAYGGPGCNRSVVKPCIPGHGCGKPNVLLSGGKGVVRTVPDKKPLWKNETERAR